MTAVAGDFASVLHFGSLLFLSLLSFVINVTNLITMALTPLTLDSHRVLQCDFTVRFLHVSF